MKFKVEYNPDFYIDIAQAVEWYNEKQAGLGDRLLKIIKQQTVKLAAPALHFEIKYDDIRCMRIEKSPYMVHYRVNEQTPVLRTFLQHPLKPL